MECQPFIREKLLIRKEDFHWIRGRMRKKEREVINGWNGSKNLRHSNTKKVLEFGNVKELLFSQSWALNR